MENLVDSISLLCRLHSQAEMDVLYPVVERSLGVDGKKMVQESLEEHSNVEQEALKALELRKSGGDDLSSTLQVSLIVFFDRFFQARRLQNFNHFLLN